MHRNIMELINKLIGPALPALLFLWWRPPLASLLYAMSASHVSLIEFVVLKQPGRSIGSAAVFHLLPVTANSIYVKLHST
jgi:hypothetical protein